MNTLKYLGIITDSNLNWERTCYVKSYVKSIMWYWYIIKTSSFCLKTYTYSNLLFMNLPYLTYGVIIWGHTYWSNIKPLYIMQKKAIRIINFLTYQEHTSSYFKKDVLKLADIVKLYTTLFMYQFYRDRLPVAFDDFFVLNNMKHDYNTRLSSKCSYNYRIFSIFRQVQICLKRN